MGILLDVPPAAAGGALEQIGKRSALPGVEHLVDPRSLRGQHLTQDPDAFVVPGEGGAQCLAVERLRSHGAGEVGPALLPLGAESLPRCPMDRPILSPSAVCALIARAMP